MLRLAPWTLLLLVLCAWGCSTREPEPEGVPPIPPGRRTMPGDPVAPMPTK